jgi:hypothetical protein
MSIEDAKAHLDEAMRFLTLEAYRGTDPDNMQPVDDFTIAEELERIDRALGPKGQSMFAHMGDRVRSAYVEIKAASEALK